MAFSDKRATVFPGNPNLNSLGKRPAEVDPEALRLSSSLVPKIPEFLRSEARSRPPPIPLGVNPDSAHYSSRSRFPAKQKHDPAVHGFACIEGNPWKDYYAILQEQQDSEVTIAHKQDMEHLIVAIKQARITDRESTRALAGCLHENIVSLYRAYVEDEMIFFIYECTDVSLAEVQSTPYGQMVPYQMAAICQEVLKGIQYIHQELEILHGSIDTHSVMISRNGNVKLANIGQSMLKAVASSGNEQEDFRALGLLMVRLMEFGTSLQDPDLLELRRPEEWDKQIVSFLKKTGHCSGEVLQQDEFLERSPTSHCLKPLVFISERSVQRDWEPCMK